MAAREALASSVDRGIVHLDPRTKLALLLTISVFVLSYSTQLHAGIFTRLLAAVPLALMLAARRWRAAGVYAALYGSGVIAEQLLLPHLGGFAAFLAVAVAGMFTRFGPGVAMGYYTVTTTTASEFVASMQRMHVPDQITIPVSVMFRFFPTVFEEACAVGDAMRMRGVRLGGAKASQILEYRVVPMIMCSVKIGEELSAAALTRGLGGPVRRTNICRIGFGALDITLLALCVAAALYVCLGWAVGA